MSSTTTYLPKLYLRLLNLTRSLPRDPLRPTLQLPATLESAVHRAFGVDPIPRHPSLPGSGGGTSATAAETVRGLSDSPSHAGASCGGGEAALSRAARHIDEEGKRTLIKAAEALEAIKGDKAMREYPLSNRTLSPPSDPMYYTRLVQGVELSAQGKARSWYKRFFAIKGEA